MSQHDFDFLIGSWHVHNRRLKRRLEGSDDWEEFGAISHMTPVLGGMVNTDELSLSDGTSLGVTLRAFHLPEKRWFIYWIGARDGVLQPPVSGNFQGDTGLFYGDDEWQGQPCLCRFIWSVKNPQQPRWEQAFSVDGGQTWETNWTMTLMRLEEGEAI